jgi:hypothetical protein
VVHVELCAVPWQVSASARNKEVNCACVGEIITIINENARNITHKKNIDQVFTGELYNLLYWSDNGYILAETRHLLLRHSCLSTTFVCLVIVHKQWG